MERTGRRNGPVTSSIENAVDRFKRYIPFTIKHSARTLGAYAPRRARQLASAGTSPRTPWHRAFHKTYRRHHFRSFFAPLLDEHALVFDIGANVGEWTSVFRALGCTVVAVEPQHSSALLIRARHSHDPMVTVEECAVGDTPGTAELFLAASPEHASMSTDFMQALIANERADHNTWGTPQTVPVVTLADLCTRHGTPDYIKLDIEGFEPRALRTLSIPVRLVSFEFHRELLANVRECTTILSNLAPYAFNFTLGEWLGFSETEWLSARWLLHRLEALGRYGWGNAFARLLS